MKKKIISLLLSLFMFLGTTSAFAHSGRTDSYGGHYVRTAGKGYKVGTYHYHSGPYKGYTVNQKGQVPDAFKKKYKKAS